MAYMICLVLFIIYNWPSIKDDLFSIDRTSFIIICAAGILTGFLANLLYMFVLKDNDSYIIAALIYSSPIFTFILAIYFLKERVTFMGIFGFFLIVFGVICLALNENNKPENFVSLR